MAQFVRQWPELGGSIDGNIILNDGTGAAAGNTLIAIVAVRDNQLTTCTVTDNGGNQWVEVDRLASAESSAAQVIMHAQDIEPLTSLTVTTRGADGVSSPSGTTLALILEVSGVGGIADVNKGYSNASPSVQNLVDAPADGFVIGGGTAAVTNRTWSPAAFYTALNEHRNGQTTVLG